MRSSAVFCSLRSIWVDERNANVKPFVAELLETCLVLTKQLLELEGMSREFADEIHGKERALASKRVDASAFSLPSIPGIDRKVLNLISAAEEAKDSVLLLFRACIPQWLKYDMTKRR